MPDQNSPKNHSKNEDFLTNKNKTDPQKSNSLLPVNKKVPLPSYLKSKADVNTDENLDPETMTIQDVFKMIEKFRKMHDDVELQLDEIYRRTGLTPKEIQLFLSNPNNFSMDQWNNIQLEKKAHDEFFKIQTSQTVSPMQTSQSKDVPGNKERRAKSVSSRRNWIPVR